MVRMPDEESKKPLTELTAIMKRKPGQNNEADGGEGEGESEAQREEENIKEIIRRKVVRH